MIINNVVITGHTSGIGNACMKYFISKGYGVIGVSRTKLADNSYEGLIEYECDLSRKYKRKWLLREIVAEYPNLTGLINNAGILIFDESYKDYDKIMSINLETQLHLSLILGATILKGGFIINIASVAGMRAEADNVIYAISKAGVISMTKSLAKKFAPDGIRVNSVSPGFINTPLCPGDTPSFLIDGVPLKREGDPVEVVEVIWNLAHNSYVTGANWIIDGGLTA